MVLALLGLIGWFAFDHSAPGALIAGIAGAWGTMKAKLFGGDRIDLEKEIGKVEDEHAAKREEWANIKGQYDEQYRAMRARMDYLDYKSALLSEQLGSLDADEQQRLDKVRNMTADEKTTRFNELLGD